MTPFESASSAAHPVVLRIHFQNGERPHCFWISAWKSAAPGLRRYKILSKRLATGELEALVIEERDARPRRGLERIVVPRDAPSGWLELWARRIAEELAIELRCFDLSRVETAAEWTRTAASLGWQTGSQS